MASRPLPVVMVVEKEPATVMRSSSSPASVVVVADDKIVAVLKDDAIWSEARDITDLPKRLIERLQHYFLTYKMRPGEKPTVKVQQIYGVQRARQVVEAAIADYRAAYPGLAG